MKVWKFCSFVLLLLLSTTLGEDTVAEDIDAHQLERLEELLTSKECEDLLFALSHPEENIFQRLGRLSPEKNTLDLKPRVKRDISSPVESDAPCKTALADWLLRNGKEINYERLSHALQHIGRTDIAIEVGKNINQDKILNMLRYVEDYHRYVETLNIPPVDPDTEDPQPKHPTARKRQVRDVNWRDLNLIVKRAPVPLYQRGPSDVALPLLYGLLLGFGVPLLAGVFMFLVICVSRKNNGTAIPPGSPGEYLR